MNTTTHTSMSTRRIQQLAQYALTELRQARAVDDGDGIARTERRMNALLDQLAKRLPRQCSEHRDVVALEGWYDVGQTAGAMETDRARRRG